MKNASAEYFKYKLEFNKPFLTSHGNLKYREGIIIKIVDKNGVELYGEAAPLDGHSADNFNNNKNILLDLKKDILHLINAKDIKGLYELSGTFFDYPGVKAALEQIVINYLLIYKNDLFPYLYQAQKVRRIDIAALLGADMGISETLKAIDCLSGNFSVFKIKVGIKDFQEDYALLKAVKAKFGNNISIRLDANGAWTLNQAFDYLNKLSSLNMNIEFIEQPVNKIEEFIELKGKTCLKIAVDETINSYQNAVLFIQEKAADIIILKQMSIGGALTCSKIVSDANESGIDCVVSSLFESEIGFSASLFLAALSNYKTAHGLGTLCYFKNGTLNSKIKVVKGKIENPTYYIYSPERKINGSVLTLL